MERLILAAALLTLSAGIACAQEKGAAAAPHAEWVFEPDAYYTSLGLHVPLTDAPIPDSHGGSEAEIYRELLIDSVLRPQLFLLEGSVNPMPVLGTVARSRWPGLYRNAAVGQTNLVESLTAGFQEPWALSAFLGTAMNFSREGERRRGTNKGYIGFLVSAGRQHIKDNVLVQDPWMELEWKLKGERVFNAEELNWSFRAGAKFHDNPDVADTVYLGAKRSQTTFGGGWLSFLRNSEFSVQTNFTQHHPEFAFGEALVGKKFPLEHHRFAFVVDTGVLVETRRKYDGQLRDHGDVIFVLRPNIEF